MAELRELQEERRQAERPGTLTESMSLPTDPDALASFFQLRSALQNRVRQEPESGEVVGSLPGSVATAAVMECVSASR